MKKLMLFAAIVLMMVSCNESRNYEIRVVNYSGEGPVLLMSFSKPDWHVEDTAVMEGGVYYLRGEIEPGRLMYIDCGGDKTMVIVEPGKIEYDAERNRVSGTEHNDLLAEYMFIAGAMEQASDEWYRLREEMEMDDEKAAEMQKHIDEMDQEWMKLTKDVITENIENALGIGLFARYVGVFADQTECLDSLVSGMGEEFMAYDEVRQAKESAESILSTAVGRDMTDFEFVTIEGNTMRLSELVAKNRYVLIDFWASWCLSCRSEMPALRALYEKERGNGLCIVGVSLDDEEEQWKAAIEKYGIDWIHTSELKRWNSAPAELYGVKAIPSMVLIGHDGKIVAREFSVEKIAAYIYE